MPSPTRADLELNDTPALAVFARRRASFEGVDPLSLRACQDLLRVAKRSLAAFGAEFARHGISPGRYSVLMELYHASVALAPSELADEMPGRVGNVHFTDVFENGEMTFDYRLRPGVVKTSNALRLLKQAGIEIEADDALTDAPPAAAVQ